MTIFNLGSINADLFYRLPHLPQPGETLAASTLTRGLGGKGANMSVAAARAAARVVHLGAVGRDGTWAVQRLMEYGVDTRRIAIVEDTTGHAIIMVDDTGENAIVLHAGANHAISFDLVAQTLSEAQTGDTLLMQNETLLQREAAEVARDMGLRIIYAPAPFEIARAQQMIGLADLIVLNAVELNQFRQATGKGPDGFEADVVIVTEGADGGQVFEKGQVTRFDAPKVQPVDTTGAGDTFTGYLTAALDRGMPLMQAVRLATRAAAIMVTRRGTADVIPDLKDVQDSTFGN